MYVCACVSVYICMYVTKSARCSVAEPLITELSFLERSFFLVELVVKVLWCHVTLTYLFSAKMTPPVKITFFHYIL